MRFSSVNSNIAGRGALGLIWSGISAAASLQPRNSIDAPIEKPARISCASSWSRNHWLSGLVPFQGTGTADPVGLRMWSVRSSRPDLGQLQLQPQDLRRGSIIGRNAETPRGPSSLRLASSLTRSGQRGSKLLRSAAVRAFHRSRQITKAFGLSTEPSGMRKPWSCPTPSIRPADRSKAARAARTENCGPRFRCWWG